MIYGIPIFKMAAIQSDVLPKILFTSRDVQIGGRQGHSTEHVVMKQYITNLSAKLSYCHSSRV